MSLLLGPRTLSWPALALLAVAGLLGAYVGDPGADQRTRMLWVAAGLVAQLALTAVYRLAAALGAGRSRITVLITVALGSAARAVTLSILIVQLDIVDPLNSAQRLLSATITYTAWGIIFGLVVQGYAEYRATLLGLLARVDSTLVEAQALTAEWRARLRDAEGTPRALELTAMDLHADVEARVRPMSHRLWIGVTQRQARLRFGRSLLTEPLPVGWIVAAIVPLYLWPIAHQIGFVQGALVSIATALWVAAILTLGNNVARRHPASISTIRIISVLLASSVALAVDVITSDMVYPAGIAVVTLVIITAIISVQVVAVSLRQRQRGLAELHDRVDALEQQRRQVATYLHTTMQSRWTAAALQLQDAAESGDASAAQRALAQARELMEAESPGGSPTIDLAALGRPWEGIAAVDLMIPPDIPPDAQSHLSHLIEEAIANAVRHGRARNISVLVTVTPAAVQVVVDDDGVGITGSPSQGLGSQWRDDIARWDLTSTATGARLSASIALTTR